MQSSTIPANRFPVVENCLTIDGVPLTRIAERVGRTPFYAYSRTLIRERVAQLREKLPEKLELHFAIKANPMPAVVNLMATLVDGFDVASADEMDVVLNTEIAPTEISFAGPGKTVEQLRRAVAANIVINVESELELKRIESLGRELGCLPNVVLRVNPAFELKSSGMRMGGGPKQFGIDSENVPALLQSIGTMDVQYHGLHIFCGSQILKSDSLKDAHAKTVELALELSTLGPVPPKLINLGGGLGIPYFPGETPLDLQEIGTHLQQILEPAFRQLPDTSFVMELGRYLIGEAGIYVTQIVDKKVSRGETFLITDGGLNHHLAASGNFGQVIRKNYPVSIANKQANELTTVNVVGPLCTPLDLLANKTQLPDAEPGDLFVVFQSGAYGYTASPRDFLSQPAIKEILI